MNLYEAEEIIEKNDSIMKKYLNKKINGEIIAFMNVVGTKHQILMTN